MPVNLDAPGLQNVDITLGEQLEVTKKLETRVLVDQVGAFADGKGFDPTFEFSIRGKGDLPAGIAVGSDGGLTIATIVGGVTILTNVKEKEVNDDWNDWECSGGNWPSAE